MCSLRSERWKVNHKRVHRLYHLEGLKLKHTRGLPDVICMDNGREFISKATDRWAYDNRVADIRNKRLVLLYVD